MRALFTPVLAIIMAIAAATCSPSETSPAPSSGGGGVPALSPSQVDESAALAVVNGIPVYRDDLSAIREAEPHLSWKEALNRRVAEILLSMEARRRGLDTHGDVLRTRQNALAFSLLQARADAISAGSIDAARVEARLEKSKRRFFLGPRRQVVHALVRTGPNFHEDKKAAQIARELYRSLQSSTSADEFKSIAKPFGDQYAHVKTESLPPFDAETPRLVAPFVKATFAVDFPRTRISPPVHTDFGWHVIFIVEELPGQETTVEEARAILREEIAAEDRVSAIESLLGEQENEAEVFYFDAADRTGGDHR